MAKVDSFELDHTQVRAPYVRLAGVKYTPHGDAISKYDLRLVQPNTKAIESGALHTLEHLLAGGLRDHLEQVLDVSPMGCRTGFYLSLVATPDLDHVKTALERVLGTISQFEGSIPGVSELECGNYRDHDLVRAKKYAQNALDQGFIIQETVAILST